MSLNETSKKIFTLCLLSTNPKSKGPLEGTLLYESMACMQFYFPLESKTKTFKHLKTIVTLSESITKTVNTIRANGGSIPHPELEAIGKRISILKQCLKKATSLQNPLELGNVLLARNHPSRNTFSPSYEENELRNFREKISNITNMVHVLEQAIQEARSEANPTESNTASPLDAAFELEDLQKTFIRRFFKPANPSKTAKTPPQSPFALLKALPQALSELFLKSHFIDSSSRPTRTKGDSNLVVELENKIRLIEAEIKPYGKRTLNLFQQEKEILESIWLASQILEDSKKRFEKWAGAVRKVPNPERNDAIKRLMLLGLGINKVHHEFIKGMHLFKDDLLKISNVSPPSKKKSTYLQRIVDFLDRHLFKRKSHSSKATLIESLQEHNEALNRSKNRIRKELDALQRQADKRKSMPSSGSTVSSPTTPHRPGH